MPSIGLHGIYCDSLVDAASGIAQDRGWQSNRIVNNCNRLLAALMKGQAGMQGVLYLAIGEGEAAWDSAAPSPTADTSRLAGEWHRQAITSEQMVFLDALGMPSLSVTDQLQITVNFSGAELVASGYQSLREFGLFGGDATAAPDSGYLINYVIHPRIDLTAQASLIRVLRLQFGVAPLMASQPLALSTARSRALGSVLSRAAIVHLDGVGERYAAALIMGGVSSIGELAESDVMALDVGIARTTLVELQAKAVLAVQSAARAPAVKALARHSASRVATSTTAMLMSATGASEAAIAEARAQAAALQLALNETYLERMSIEELTQTRAVLDNPAGVKQ